MRFSFRWSMLAKFLSTPSARRATVCHLLANPCRRISIHALREEGDPLDTVKNKAVSLFLSTPSARRATSSCGPASTTSHISIHALREEGDLVYARHPESYPRISIHALREEGDWRSLLSAARAKHFYPRPPRGGRRLRQRPEHLPLRISIHALREEGDGIDRTLIDKPSISIHALREEGDIPATTGPTSSSHFYPRPPRGGRPCLSCGSKTQ